MLESRDFTLSGRYCLQIWEIYYNSRTPNLETISSLGFGRVLALEFEPRQLEIFKLSPLRSFPGATVHDLESLLGQTRYSWSLFNLSSACRYHDYDAQGCSLYCLILTLTHPIQRSRFLP